MDDYGDPGILIYSYFVIICIMDNSLTQKYEKYYYDDPD